MRFRRLNPPEHEAINVTPLIDVVMCLIVFFLIVGKLAHDRAAGVRLPASAVGTADAVSRLIVVEIAPLRPGERAADAFGPAMAARVLVDGKTVADEAALKAALLARLPAGNPGDPGAPPVQVRADRAAPFGLIEPVVRACQELKVPSVQLVTERAG
jgi:biopolymer transport protein ExbD